MSKVIRNYELNFGKAWKVEMPKGSEIIDVQVVDDKPFVFALLTNTPDGKKQTVEEKTFELFLSNQEIPDEKGVKRIHIKTFLVKKVPYHFFEKIEKGGKK